MAMVRVSVRFYRTVGFNVHRLRYDTVRVEAGPDLGGPMGPRAPGLPPKGASHQTLQFLFRAHYTVN